MTTAAAVRPAIRSAFTLFFSEIGFGGGMQRDRDAAQAAALRDLHALRAAEREVVGALVSELEERLHFVLRQVDVADQQRRGGNGGARLVLPGIGPGRDRDRH